MSKKLNIASLVRSIVEKPINDLGLDIWDVTLYKEGAELTLEVALDKEGGVSIEDCSKTTKLIEPLIDELNPIEEGYYLMVSSAGVDRELRTAEHIEYAIKASLPVTFKLFSAFEGKKEYSGIIAVVDSDTITMRQSGTESETVLPKKLVAKMTAHFSL
ncbi:MAG: ribosome maturation factor [Firmicutes bacterium HGW-Firmicutes-21]|nr:MAG: ribosome maturation factor [Firmicutes bacterium HGW-Firmicutes-21]